MTRQEPPAVADERTMLKGWLDFHRQTMLAKIEGLDEQQARFKPTPGGNSLIGLIVHLAHVERWWFYECFLNEDVPLPDWADPRDRDWDFHVPESVTLAEAVGEYRREIARSDEILAAASLDDLSAHHEHNGISMRWILTHMVEETARHAGHADITREMIDGSTGV